MTADQLSSATTSSVKSPLRYQAAYEQPEPDEALTTAEIIETMGKIQRTVADDAGRAMRSVHAKSHGLLRGELRVSPGLSAQLAQGLFTSADTYPLVMRFSTTPGDILDDSVSTPRGMAVKVFGVVGDRLPGSESDTTQDFVLVNGPAFLKPNAKSFLKSLKLLAATTNKAEGLKKAVSAVMRGTEKAVEAFGGKSPTLIGMGGQPETHLLGDSYFSQVPILFGDYMAKICVVPISPELKALTNAALDVNGKPTGLRDAVVDFFQSHGGEWELRVQLCTNIDTMPLEDASVVWPEDESPYIAVARISVMSQQAWDNRTSPAKEDALSFSPWHGLAAHRPLGSIMRVRKAAYEMSARLRADRNRTSAQEPRTPQDVSM